MQQSPDQKPMFKLNLNENLFNESSNLREFAQTQASARSDITQSFQKHNMGTALRWEL